jgi:hypothetical protein
MRAHQIIAGMSPEAFETVMEALRAEAPEAIQSTTVAAAAVLKFRPKFLQKQPPKKRLGSIRSAMSRPGANAMAEELLAVFVLKCRLGLLTEWLDLMELEHEEGILTQDEVPCPDAAVLESKVATFRGAGDDPDRDLLMKIFAAQTSIDWPALDTLLEA